MTSDSEGRNLLRTVLGVATIEVAEAKEMEAVMSSPEKRQFVWNRRLAQLDYISQIDSARNEGRAEGKSEGILSTLTSLVKKGRLTIEEAAEESKMSVAEFTRQAGIQVLQ